MLLKNIQVRIKSTNELGVLKYTNNSIAKVYVIRNNKLELIETEINNIEENRENTYDIHRKGKEFIVNGELYKVYNLNKFKVWADKDTSYLISEVQSHNRIKDMTTLELLEVYKEYIKNNTHDDTFLTSLYYANYGNELIERWIHKDMDKSQNYRECKFEYFLRNIKNMTNEEILKEFLY